MSEGCGPYRESTSSDLRSRVLDAVVAIAGERGLSGLTSQVVIARVGATSRTFRREFESMETAFAAAYERLANELCARVLAAGRQGEDWRSGFRAALDAYLGWVADNPAQARVLLVEYRFGDPRVGAIHEQLCARLERALETARSAASAPETLPDLTPAFVLGAIEAASSDLVMRGEAARAAELAERLEDFAALLYFGPDVHRS